jgi:hypothetical protein
MDGHYNPGASEPLPTYADLPLAGYYNQMSPEIGGGNPTITVFALKP